MIIFLSELQKEHLNLLHQYPTQVLIDFCKLALDYLSNGINDKKYNVAAGGCVLLPFLWAVNAVWFFKEAFTKPPFEEQREIKKYVLMSAAGAAVWAAVIIAWVTVFQVQRTSWGPVGDSLSFVLPLGRA